ncbi:MAG: citrate lyase holo-[acyl-carrier protein] synthase [Christensenellaceae bacterium]|nr:citrate lyase holo-[acyl-carrier protein] synthase [Christensenellaceae bacterium]
MSSTTINLSPYNHLTERIVSVSDMADRREKRACEQRSLIERHKLPIICITMNIAGPIKRSGLIDWAFFRALGEVQRSLNVDAENVCNIDSIIAEVQYIFEKTGCEAMFAVRLDPKEAKRRMVELEDGSDLGRLFDIDVIGMDGNKLSRSEPRRCLICGGTAAVCARSRAHMVEELQDHTRAIISTALSDRIADLAARALYEEVHTTPKPGLVDERNSGANSDMDITLFERSIAAIKPYFRRMAEAALKFCSQNARSQVDAECVCIKESYTGIYKEFSGISYNALMTELRYIGIEAERAMLAATNGVNTHRGAIYSLGLIVSAYALVIGDDAQNAMANARHENGCDIVSQCVLHAAKLASSIPYDENATTNGAIVRRAYGVGGAIEQAQSGFPLAMLAKKLQKEYDVMNGTVHVPSIVNGWTYALLGIMAELDDNNALKRGGRSGADFVKSHAFELLNRGVNLQLSELQHFDDELIKRNISCGGAADMLSVAIMLHMIEGDCRIN